MSKRPEKVLEEIREEQRIHYFYWSWDVYKKDDYEPVKVHGEAVLSRVHWRGLVIWGSPLTKEGKPLVKFVPGVHTPIVVSEDRQKRILRLREISSYDWTALQLFLAYIDLLAEKLPNKLYDYSDLIVAEKPPEEYLFRPEDCDYAVLVGKVSEKIAKELLGKKSFIKRNFLISLLNCFSSTFYSFVDFKGRKMRKR